MWKPLCPKLNFAFCHATEHRGMARVPCPVVVNFLYIYRSRAKSAGPQVNLLGPKVAEVGWNVGCTGGHAVVLKCSELICIHTPR